jgi:Kef-type K+ transport system membrane component KefB
VVASLVLRLFATLTRAEDALLTLGIICCCVLLYAFAPPLGLSPILAALFFGLVVRATDASTRLLSHQTSETGKIITIGYFVLVGASLPRLDSWTIAGVAAAVAATRLAAKVAANAAVAVPSALSVPKGALVGMASAPLSSLALALVAIVAQQPELQRAAQTSAGVVVFMAIVGPALTELSLRRAGEPARQTA